MSDLIRLSVSPHFINKDNHAPATAHKSTGEISNAWAFSAFDTVAWTPAQIYQHVTSGKAICVAALKGTRRRREDFESAQIVGLDFDDHTDVEHLMSDPFIEEYGFLVYRTPSWTAEAPRARVLFILDRPILDGAQYKRLVLRLLQRFESADDLKDEVRIFYGSTHGGAEWVDVRLPVAILEALPPHPSELQPAAQPVKPAASIAEDRLRKYVDRAVERELNALVGTRAHRNTALNETAFALGTLVGAPWAGLSRTDVENSLIAAAEQNGYVNKDGRSAALSTIRSGIEAGMAQPRSAPRDTPLSTKRVGQEFTDTVPAYVPNPNEPQWDSAPPPPLPALEDVFDDRKSALLRYLRLLDEDTIPDAPPLVMPFHTLHRFGGFAHILTPGKLVGVAASTGGGKTSFLDSLVDKLLEDGEHVIRWSPEWSSDEDAERFAQRLGGATMEDILLHQIWKYEQAHSVPEKSRLGVRLPDRLREASASAVATAAAWPGNVYDCAKAGVNLDTLLNVIIEKVGELRSKKVDVRTLVIDYAQMFEANQRDSRERSLNDAIQMVKSMCIDHKLVGIIASQVTKADSRQTGSTGEKKLLDMNSAQFLRFDAFNLAFTLHIERLEDGTATGNGAINVIKNSIGRTGVVSVPVNLNRLLWVDKLAPRVNLADMTITDDDGARSLRDHRF